MVLLPPRVGGRDPLALAGQGLDEGRLVEEAAGVGPRQQIDDPTVVEPLRPAVPGDPGDVAGGFALLDYRGQDGLKALGIDPIAARGQVVDGGPGRVGVDDVEVLLEAPAHGRGVGRSRDDRKEAVSRPGLRRRKRCVIDAQNAAAASEPRIGRRETIGST